MFCSTGLLTEYCVRFGLILWIIADQETQSLSGVLFTYLSLISLILLIYSKKAQILRYSSFCDAIQISSSNMSQFCDSYFTILFSEVLSLSFSLYHDLIELIWLYGSVHECIHQIKTRKAHALEVLAPRYCRSWILPSCFRTLASTLPVSKCSFF
ncbi:hypothetical protein P170DRAFT_133508 [Aspergillus steynii IBT 23096]|uniref:Uncharacterized protein n=1 Tax=Aspergillus steynii IBT 23096 TaxID=1392250 RepID=A0A2I2GAK7_9EURO|nr:uncharacterized protein P170DRAFT_133508 [Aspergillus steynii IBT 23096]PLB49907.1 hypothetical protein P170DRAFT_133508 [Aspergillus steynii IBT 23096]